MFKILGADGKEYGPVNADQIRLWISEGRLNGASRILPEGGVEWKMLRELPEFAGSLPPPPAIVLPPAHTPMHPASPKNNTLAMWSFGTGIASLFCCCTIASPVSIVLGIMALSDLKKNPGQEGKNYAIAGIVLGVISLFFTITAWVISLVTHTGFADFQNFLPK